MKHAYAQRAATRRPSLRPLVGLGFLGYGLLVLVKVLPHDSVLAGLAALVVGWILLRPGLPTLRTPRALLVSILGAIAVVGVLGYNWATDSDLGIPEWGILAYGLALVGSAAFLDRRVAKTTVGALVGWSFPLVLAPLALFALNGALSSESTGAAASPIVGALIVLPTAFALRLFGTPIELVDNNLVLETSHGSLTLGVGLVCAGLYPIVLFGGLVGVYAWEHRLSRRSTAACVGFGLLGLWILNLLRLVLLARIGQSQGPAALQEAHANLGWILFGLYMAVFWAVVFRIQRPARRAKRARAARVARPTRDPGAGASMR